MIAADELTVPPGRAAFTRNIPRILLFQALANASLWMLIWILFTH